MALVLIECTGFDLEAIKVLHSVLYWVQFFLENRDVLNVSENG